MLPTTKPGMTRLFISYSRKDKDEVYAFADALMANGVDVWLDREDIDPLDDFPARIRDGLARSSALLAWYSLAYPQSTYCQKELIAAWIAAQRDTRDILSRILIVNPEPGTGHIALGDVSRQNYVSVSKDTSSWAKAIDAMRARMASVSENFAALREFRIPPWFPTAQQGTSRFVGRVPELWRIHNGLNPIGIGAHENPYVLIQATGLGGVGKTMLAIEYAKRFGAAYPGGIFWLRAYGFDEEKAQDASAAERHRCDQMEDLAIEHHIPVQDCDPREIRRDLGRKLASGQSYLWIVDDLPPGLDQTRELPLWFAPSANGRTLVTTRGRDYAGLGVGLEIDVLTPASAIELLTQKRKARTAAEHSAAAALAEDLGYHALALDVAGHFLLVTKDFAELRSELRNEVRDPLGKLAHGLQGQLPGGHEKSIVTTLLKSIELLGEEGFNVLLLAGELHGATPIPLQLASQIIGQFRSEEGDGADYVARAINQLDTHSLARVARGTNDDTLSVHTLVRYTLRYRAAADDAVLNIKAALRESAAMVLLHRLSERVRDVRNYPALELEVNHCRHLAENPATATDACLAIPLSNYDGDRGRVGEALALISRALPIIQGALGPRDQWTLGARHGIAVWTGASGKPQRALGLLQDLLRDQDSWLGADDPATLTTRSTIAHATAEAGDAAGAAKLFGALLPDRMRVLGADHHDTLRTRNNFALWTGETGNPQEAIRLLRDLLPDAERVLGADHADVLKTRHNVALFLSKAGQGTAALTEMCNLLPQMEEVFGADHPETLKLRNNVADVTGVIGDAPEALRLFDALLPVLERVRGYDDRNSLMVRLRMASLHGEMRQDREALQLFEALLPHMTRIFGADHRETLECRGNIAYYTGTSGDPHKALDLYRKLLRDRETILGPTDPTTLRSRLNMVGFTVQTTGASKALRLLKPLVADMKRLLRTDHPDTVAARKLMRGLKDRHRLDS